ncbi:gliding motility-associated C-terminal domain-containing protein [Echinicola marina]|uniref:T9SS type B sorting domain-containing protein n=1 Tax=Echinicola marina TaxID=2859768 RepID=UPI001CF6534E|nr:gliding motility-associated C-terminal domain-containing protein [Echinicola marina]UCS94789.1 gliding motility-associated C-terminal domain-containing protein [Echinicola marina]
MHQNPSTHGSRLLWLYTFVLCLCLGTNSKSYASPPLAVEVSGKLALCSYEEKGNIILNVSGGVAPYQYEWPSIKQYTSSIDNLNAGKYTVIITDANGLELTKEILIQPPYPLIGKLLQTEAATCGAANGTAEIKVVVGRGDPYRFEWSNGLKGTTKAENLEAGDHSVEIFDKYNCSTTLYFTIEEKGSPIHIDESIQHNSCGSTDKGAISLDITGGQAPYAFTWSNGATTNNLNQLSSGEYSVEIKDASGCSINKTFQIQQSQEIQITVQKQNISCNGADNGWISLTIEGGTAPYTVKWSDTNENVKERSQLKPGTYTASISDGNGCITEKNITLSETSLLDAKLFSMVNVDCSNGTATGTAWLNIEGGLPPYKIVWHNGIENQNEISFNQAQEISVTITDAKGCITHSSTKGDFPSNLARTNFTYELEGFSTSEDIIARQPVVFKSNTSEEVIAWEWNFGDGSTSEEPNPVHQFVKKGEYEVTLRVHNIYGCSSAFTNTIEVEDNSSSIKIPNAFSPNGDGLNDYFMPKFKNISEFELSIFNTWGELIYHQNNADEKGWDGSYKGAILPPGNYVYKVQFSDLENKVFEEGGIFTLIR